MRACQNHKEERSGTVLSTILDHSRDLVYRNLSKRVVMNYKLNPQLSLIKAPVILVTEGKEGSYESGEDLTTLDITVGIS